MIKTSVFAIASIGFLAASGFAAACEMHGKGHTAMQTAATQSVTPPVITPSPKPEPVALQAAPAPAEAKAMSAPEAMGGIGCPRMRKQQTVYYTD